MAAHFHSLPIKRVTPDAAGSAAITLAVPPALLAAFDFRPGQFLTLRAAIDGQQVRRSYSICSPHQRYLQAGEIDIGIKPVQDGVFSRWALANLSAGSSIDAMPPDGRFTPRDAATAFASTGADTTAATAAQTAARHYAGFAAGSGITPLLSIIGTTLAAQPGARFTLVYGNRRVNTIMFHEALQDLKDLYPARFTLIHLLSRQPQEVALFNGRIDEAKVGELLQTLLPAAGIDEAFICGPEAMIEATQRALLAHGMSQGRVHSERFFSADNPVATKIIAAHALPEPATGPNLINTQLDVVLDGKTHRLAMGPSERVLDVALAAGLDLPYSCKGGVCCTCRARVLEGRVEMLKNFTLEADEIDRGFVLTCQARPLTPRVVVSYDER